ncbi:MAG: hypothetical protein V4685_04735 [Bacteroidota bacterium]
MRPITILLFTLIIGIPASAQFLDESFNTKEVIKANRVQSETIYQSTKSFGNRLHLIKNYDSNANLVSNWSFSFREQLFSSDTLMYDSNFKCIKKIQFDKNGIAKSDYIYTYNKNGDLLLIEVFKGDTLVHSQKKVYNENNQLVKDSMKNQHGNYFESAVLFYNEDGLKIKTVITLAPDNTYTTTYKYDKKKMLVEKHLNRIDSEVFYTYSYNAHDQCKKEKRVVEKGGKKTKTIIEYSYLPNGLLDKQEEYKEDKAPKIFTFQYLYY